MHLQFDYAQQQQQQQPFADGVARGTKHPWGRAAGLRKWLVSEQPYDVRVELDMPRTRANRDAGNFMLDVKLFGPPAARSGTTVGDGIAPLSVDDEEDVVLAQSSRPAILTWYSDVVENVGKAVALPWYLVGWRREAERLVVGVMEGVAFERGSWKRLPDEVGVEVRSAGRLQVYGCWVVFEARLGGLRYVFFFFRASLSLSVFFLVLMRRDCRYFMYNYRLTAALVFTTLFWAVEMTFMILAWLALSQIFAPRPLPTKQEPKQEDETDVKTEGETETDLPDLSDTPRTFPTYAGQPSLRYESPNVKSEEDEAGGVSRDVPVAAGAATGQEADDEDEDADFVLDTAGRHMDRDSGLGTSMESGQERREAVRKRRSGLFGSGSRNQ